MDMKEKLVELQKAATREFMSSTTDVPLTDFIAGYLIANGVTVQEWISVEDRLPDACGNVLAYSTEYGNIDLYYYMGQGEFDHYRNGITDAQTHRFTHWMPLPQPPVDFSRMFENVSIDDLRSYREKTQPPKGE